MIEIRELPGFGKWLARLKDRTAQALIAARLNRFANGQPGDVKSVGGGIGELRIHHGPGYRVYFYRSGGTIVVLLCGGDKSSQARDIASAKRLLDDWLNERSD